MLFTYLFPEQSRNTDMMMFLYIKVRIIYVRAPHFADKGLIRFQSDPVYWQIFIRVITKQVYQCFLVYCATQDHI